MKQGLAIITLAAALVTAGCADMNPFRDDSTGTRASGSTGASSGSQTSQMETQKSFARVDQDGDDNISKTEAQEAGLDQLVRDWSRADKDHDDVLDHGEFSSFTEQR